MRSPYAGNLMISLILLIITGIFLAIHEKPSADGFFASVERTLARLNRNKHLAKDFQATIDSAKAWLMIAIIKLVVGSLARQ